MQGGPGVQGCLGGVQEVPERSRAGPATSNILCRRFQNANGSGPLRCLPPFPDFKVFGGGKGEVKPPKCPTRQSGLADNLEKVIDADGSGTLHIAELAGNLPELQP